jgi:hypothetical protein
VTSGYKENYDQLTRDIIIDQHSLDFFETEVKASVDDNGNFTLLEMPSQYWEIRTRSSTPPPVRPVLLYA